MHQAKINALFKKEYDFGFKNFWHNVKKSYPYLYKYVTYMSPLNQERQLKTSLKLIWNHKLVSNVYSNMKTDLKCKNHLLHWTLHNQG